MDFASILKQLFAPLFVGRPLLQRLFDRVVDLAFPPTMPGTAAATAPDPEFEQLLAQAQHEAAYPAAATKPTK